MAVSQHLLIDANIAKSCNDPAREATSAACLELTFVLSSKGCSVGVALTPLLEEEWARHASRVFKRWWASMESRGRIRFEKDLRVTDYRSALLQVTSEKAKLEMEKDAHLVEAAILHGIPVASRDDAQERYLIALRGEYGRLGSIQWFNPVLTQGWRSWIESGCLDTAAFRLGDRPPEPEAVCA